MGRSVRWLALVAILGLVAGCSGGATAQPSAPAVPPSLAVPPSVVPSSPSAVPSVSPSAEPRAGEGVRIESADGVTLDGRLFGDGEDGVVLAHMRPASMASWFPFAETLADAGYTALAFGFLADPS